MGSNNRSNIGLILVALMIVGVTATGKDSQSNNSTQICSSQLSLIQKSQLSRLQAENTEQLSTYLINGSNIVQKLLDNDINFINQIIINIKQFLIRTLKPSIYLSIFILSFVFISQRCQYLAKLSFLQQNRGVIDSITSNIRKLTPYLLGVCAIIIIFSAIRAIIIVKDQPKHFSEVSCLLGNGPKLRLYEDGKQKLLMLNETIQLLSSQQVYFKEDLLQLALFVDYRLYLTQNLNLANMIKKSSNIKKAQKEYLSEIQLLIATLQQMVTIQTMQQSTHLKRHFHTYVSTHVQEAKLFLGLNKMLDGNFMYPLIYDFQIILFSACLIISLMLAFFAFKKITKSNQQNHFTRLLRSFTVYLIVIIFIFFAVLSLIIMAMFWVNNGVLKPILNNEFLDKLKQIHMAVDFTEKYLPNSGATREIRRQQLLKKAQFYYNMFNPLAQKENDYCYNLFKKSLPFLNAQEKKQIMSKLDTKYINSSELVTQTKIAQDTFRRIIISLNKTSALNRIQYSDYGDYVSKVLIQLRKVIFTNFYALRSQAGELCGALIIFYTLSFISGEKNGDRKTHIRIKSQDVENQSILEESL